MFQKRQKESDWGGDRENESMHYEGTVLASVINSQKGLQQSSDHHYVNDFVENGNHF